MRIFQVILVLLSAPSIAFALEGESFSPPSFCRIDGIPGGNVEITVSYSTCYGVFPANIQRMQAIALRDSQERAGRLCPFFNLEQANRRCRATTNRFSPNDVPDLTQTRARGTIPPEWQAIAVEKVGREGKCTFSYVTERSSKRLGSCGILFFPHIRTQVKVQTLCGYICN